MTENEVIQALEHMTTLRVHPTYGWQEMSEVRDIAISAIKEIQQYREIGTLEECREAVEKQTQKGCVIDSCPDHTHYKCPSCGQIKLSIYKTGNRFVRLKGITKYCENCGQALLDEDLQTPTGEQVE